VKRHTNVKRLVMTTKKKKQKKREGRLGKEEAIPKPKSWSQDRGTVKGVNNHSLKRGTVVRAVGKGRGAK